MGMGAEVSKLSFIVKDCFGHRGRPKLVGKEGIEIYCTEEGLLNWKKIKCRHQFLR
jgi:hypothetical protein